jgi:hypothetical protein
MRSPDKTAASATLHCLAGCSIGEILGMMVSSALGWQAASSIALSIILAFFFGYLLSVWPLLKHKLSLKQALKIALAADTASITVMEITDNGFILLVPNAIHAELNSVLFWISLGVSLVIAFFAAFPLNKYLISKGKGHAITHKYHERS